MELVHPYVPKQELFVEISAVKRIRDGIQYAQNIGSPVQIVSDPGYGKTTALYYLAKDMGGVYCHVGQSHKSVPDMYRMLLAACGIYHDCNYTRDLYGVLIRSLRPSEYALEHEPRKLLIVDEIQTLEATAQRELQNIQETCNLALVISGNGTRLARTKVDHTAWKQVDERLGMKIKLPRLDRQDCDLMGAAYGVEGMDTYNAIADFGSRTNARFLGRLLNDAKMLTSGTGGIRLHHIQTVLKAKPDLTNLQLQQSVAA
ncbi:ATP-binding protein [Phyllobacterium sp. 628]|uniref:AAA family ATPase n=1 Tax=Phyllobacterium sp. 628 TaxID=2718938 RepID=UPI00166261CA|nr:AAA family ATPase [Phyllobacterium sp. 628]QND52788.1 ATP-binding protein [Phyllobacterium sp. 628]